MVYFLFAIGFVALVKGADLLVDGASSLAKKLGVSSLLIGLTVVAFGTSMPELVVSFLASFSGQAELAIGNVVGSNTFNVLIILGICALITPLSLRKQTVFLEIPMAIFAVLSLLILVLDKQLFGLQVNQISRYDGIILIAFFAMFLLYSLKCVNNNKKDKELRGIKEYSTIKSLLLIFIGIAGLYIGGKWIIDGVKEIARTLGMSESLISLTIVAGGTSLPELATSILATIKRKTDLAIGNIIGSNIFNIFLILGLSSLVSNIPYKDIMNFDIYVSIYAVILLFFFTSINKDHKMFRWQGVLFLLSYILYIIYLILRG